MEISYSPIKNNQIQLNADGTQAAEGETPVSGAFLELLMNRITEGGQPAEEKTDNIVQEAEKTELDQREAERESSQEEIPLLMNLLQKIQDVVIEVKQALSGQTEASSESSKNPLVSAETVGIIRDLIKEAVQLGENFKAVEGNVSQQSEKAIGELMVYLDKKAAQPGEKIEQELELEVLENIIKEPIAAEKELREQKPNTTLILDKEQLAYQARPMTEHAANISDRNSFADYAAVPVQAPGTVQEAAAAKSPVQPLTMPFEEFAAKMEGWIQNQLHQPKGQIGEAGARIRLTPDHLGTIEVKLQFEDGRINAEIITGTQMAKDALDSQLQQLRYNLQQQGLVVQKLDIIQQPFVQEASQSEMLLADQQQQQGSGEKQENPRIQTERAAEGLKEAELLDFEYKKEHSAYLYPNQGALQTASSIDFSI